MKESTALGLRTEGREHEWSELGVYPTGKRVSTPGSLLMVLFWKVMEHSRCISYWRSKSLRAGLELQQSDSTSCLTLLPVFSPLRCSTKTELRHPSCTSQLPRSFLGAPCCHASPSTVDLPKAEENLSSLTLLLVG